MLPDQEIKEERPDRSLVVYCRVGHYEAIRNMLKDMKQWVKKESDYVGSKL
ncbi:MAG: hypothetical protein KKH97_00370 [Proteobacteria bacterium]|nr:hypothetical protein [Pseudomonadota bacterium]MBU1713546.1 hypothetical protein [Pseudomonadota bacterium]